jgi:uncharacterized protein (DUF58 family)
MTALLQPDVVARAQALGLQARTIVEGLRIGDHKSPYRGFSVEFIQHREYVPGDDIRHIDWKSYGRSERYTIKQYEQETNFVGHLVVDASRSMLYGEGDTNKLLYAKLITATLGYLIIHQRDMASLHVFDAGWRVQLPPSSQPGHVHTMLRTLESTEPKDKTSMGPLLHDLAKQIRRRGLVFLLSDCFDNVESLVSALQHLRFDGHEVTVFHIMHPDELDFPFTGNIRFEGMELPQEVLTRPHLIRPAYLKAMNAFREKLQAGCEANRCDYLLMNTGRPVRDALTEYLARRLKMPKI